MTIFGQLLFFMQQQEAKIKQYIILLYLVNEKRKSFRSSKMKVPDICRAFLPIIIGWGESSRAILNETLLSTM